MYRPSWEKRTSDIEEMISEKKDRADGSSSCSNSRCAVSRQQEALAKVSLTFGMLIAQRAFPHICELDGALGARIHEPVATLGMELCRGNDLGQFFHICWLDVDYVEALVLDIKIPKVDSKIVATDEGFAVAVYRDAVDVVRMCIRIRPPRNGSDDCVVVGHAR